MAFTAHERHGHKADLGNVAVFKVALKRALASHQIVVAHGCLARHELGFNFDDVAVCGHDESNFFPFGNGGPNAFEIGTRSKGSGTFGQKMSCFLSCHGERLSNRLQCYGTAAV